MRKIFRVVVYCLCLINIIFLFLTITAQKTGNPVTLASPLSEPEKPSEYSTQTEETDTEINRDYKIYNILLLGLDSRAGQEKPRCDAIHIFSFSPAADHLIITSIPRGTRVNLKNIATQSAYLANNCHINGIEATITEIEKIAGVKIDGYITAGFSQVVGLLRTVNLPTSPTLQYLRNRRYAIGDNQRSHNQAVFFKDMIHSHFKQFYYLPKGLKQFIFNSIDGNLSFETADYLLNEFSNKRIYSDPDKIILITKPEKSKYVREEHYEIEQIQQLGWQEDQEYKAYQKQIEGILINLISRAEKSISGNNLTQANTLLSLPYKQKLWQQIEDETKRDDIHFQLFKLFAKSSTEINAKEKIINEYRSEIELFNKTKYLEEMHKWLNG